MGQIVIYCAKCGSDQWVGEQTYTNPHGKHCANCGAQYCAKNREWKWVE
jgi:ribosomal protein L37E